MKKLAIISAACMFAISGFGQLRITSSGTGYLGDQSLFDTGAYIQASSYIIGGYPYVKAQGSKFNTDGGISIAVKNDAELAVTISKVYRSPNAMIGSVVGPSIMMYGDGRIFAKGGLLQSSDSTAKINMSSLSPTLNKIKGLHAINFNYKSEETQEAEARNQNLSPVEQQMANEKSRKRIGLIAQEVEQVYPEAVRTLPDGTKGIYYSDLIGVLVEGIKELSAQVEALQQQIDGQQNGKSKQAPKQETSKKPSSLKEDALLYQNTPNPFNQETEIAYRIPSDVNAVICIYNLSGQQLKKYPLNDTNGKVTVSASEFPAGIYIYSLIINNQEIDSKRMILTD